MLMMDLTQVKLDEVVAEVQKPDHDQEDQLLA
jgi:hypothetical protein